METGVAGLKGLSGKGLEAVSRKRISRPSRKAGLEPWSPSAPPEAGKPQGSQRSTLSRKHESTKARKGHRKGDQNLLRFQKMADTSELASAISEILPLRMLAHPEPPSLTEDLEQAGLAESKYEQELVNNSTKIQPYVGEL